MLKMFPWHSPQWQYISGAIRQDKLHHALLLSGPRGLGISEFSRLLAKSLLCTQGGTGHPCGTCKSCVLFDSANHPDVVSINPEEAGKQIKVEQIRELVSFTQQTSQYGIKKLVIIEPAEAMNRNAANGLLKTLEEPPGDTVFILNSYESMRLPVTIRSRCQRISFAPSYDDLTVDWLRQALADTQVEPRQLLQLAGGAPLRVMDLLEQDVAGKQEGLARDLVVLVTQHTDIVALAEKWREFGTGDVLKWLMAMLSRMIHLQLQVPSNNEQDNGIIPVFNELLRQFNLQQLVMCYDKTMASYHALSGPYNLNEQGILEDMLVYWQTLARHEEGSTL